MGAKVFKTKKTVSLIEKNKLIVKYTPLIRFIAKKILVRLPSNIELEDLVSSGVIGLMDAIDKYDSSRDNKFKTYAEFRIRGAILDELRSQDWVPRSIRDKAKMLERAHLELESELGRVPKEEEIAERLGIQMEDYFILLNQVRSVNIISIDEVQTFSLSDKKSLFDLLQKENTPFGDMSVKSLKKIVNKAIGELPERQRMVLSLYYYEGLNLKKIGIILKVTESRVSQLHAQAVGKLKSKLKRILSENELLSA